MKEGMRSIITCVRVLLEDLLFPFNLFSCTSRDIDVYSGHTPRGISEIVVHENQSKREHQNYFKWLPKYHCFRTYKLHHLLYLPLLPPTQAVTPPTRLMEQMTSTAQRSGTDLTFRLSSRDMGRF
jgi:hypothetical protein